MLDTRLPGVASILRDAAEALLAFTIFPIAHWPRPGRPLERIDGQVTRRGRSSLGEKLARTGGLVITVPLVWLAIVLIAV